MEKKQQKKPYYRRISNMPNNPTQDTYQPDGIGSEFEQHNFGEVNEGEIFRLNADDKDNSLYRKENETQAMDVKTRQIHDFKGNVKIFIKI